MTITYVPFESKSGFRSPGFSVNQNGDITADGHVRFNGEFQTGANFAVNGIVVLDDTDSIVSLGSQIKNSSLTSVGILERLSIEGDFTISQGSTPYINIVNGNVFIQSANGVGSIENVSIGLSKPADGNFRSVNIGPGDSSGELTVQGHAGITQDLLVGGDQTISGDLTAAGNIIVGGLPTASNHATRKDYVDARIAAFSIAFGA